MEVMIEGVKIKLTPPQIKKIEVHKKRVEKAYNSFEKMLLIFGFKKCEELNHCYNHEKNNWYAEIIDYGGWQEVWMTGEGLKNSHLFPGGWGYSTPKEIAEELRRVINNRV